jgi:hypothetical protein
MLALKKRQRVLTELERANLVIKRHEEAEAKQISRALQRAQIEERKVTRTAAAIQKRLLKEKRRRDRAAKKTAKQAEKDARLAQIATLLGVD